MTEKLLNQFKFNVGANPNEPFDYDRYQALYEHAMQNNHLDWVTSTEAMADAVDALKYETEVGSKEIYNATIEAVHAQREALGYNTVYDTDQLTEDIMTSGDIEPIKNIEVYAQLIQPIVK